MMSWFRRAWLAGVLALAPIGCGTDEAATEASGLTVVNEPAGTNCPNGGVRIEREGLSLYVCQGQDGESAQVSEEAPGTNCAQGGVRIEVEGMVSYVCDGAPGSDGSDGAPGSNGADGESITVSLESAGTNCANGGLKLESASGTAYVCHGAPGADGAPGAAGQSVAVTVEAAGTNCTYGGYKLDSASGTAYVCNGAPGAPGSDGQSVAVTLEAAGTNCTYGGFKLESASGTAYVCHGAPGADGAPGAAGQSVAVTLEAAGTNCTYGGFKLESASGTAYVCHGAPGADGAPGAAGQSVAVTPEAAGTNCANGGFKLESASGTAYVCHGAPGADGAPGAAGQSVAVTVEAAGTNCAYGGFKLVSASGTAYVCHGAPGLNSLLRITAEPAGSNCLYGGQKVESGLDANRNGVLETSEVNAAATAYLCSAGSSAEYNESLVVWGGTFYRGTTTDYPATVSNSRLDKYELTVGRFRRFVAAYDAGWRPTAGAGAHPSIAGSGWQSAWDSSLPASGSALRTNVKCSAPYQTWTDTPARNESYPINCVNWYEAFAFCAWDGGRLATEAEWEYAAAGGAREWTYPWGNSSTEPLPANYSYTASSPFVPVGSYPAGNGRWAQSDLSGSMFEWVLDYYGAYAATCNNCANLSGTYRVIRGGSWSLSATYLPAAGRNYYTPSNRLNYIGVRCARTY